MSPGLWALQARHAIPACSTKPRAPIPDPRLSPATTLLLSHSTSQRLGIPREITWKLESKKHSPFPTSQQFWKYHTSQVGSFGGDAEHIPQPFMPDSPSLPDDHPIAEILPSSAGGPETSFLFHESITAASIPKLPNAQRIHWRLVGGRVCVCSCSSWGNGCPFPHSLHHAQWTLSGTPNVVNGDGNVWCPAFHLG